MVEPFVTSSIVYGSLFGLMAIGLTLTYLTTKVPNFAYGSFVTVGLYTTFSLYRLWKINPYESLPFAFLVGGASSIVMYLGILRTLSRRGASLVALMIATLALDIVFVGIFGIYSDYLTNMYGIADSKFFFQFQTDFSMFGVPGLVFVAPISLTIITIVMFLLLTKTRFGIAMRASIENPSLARILGINVEVVYVIAWFIAGGLASMAGAYYLLWLPGGTAAGSQLIVEIFAASVLGGLASVYGAALGGVIIGASEILVTTAGIDLLGTWFSIYQKGIPLILMVITLLLLPQGIVSVNGRRLFQIGRWTNRQLKKVADNWV